MLEAVAGAHGHGPGEVLVALETVRGALRERGDADPRTPSSGDVDPSVSGSTVTALVLTADQRLAVVHVGDSRAWLLRDGALTRLTHDHTLVRSMVEAGTACTPRSPRAVAAVLTGTPEPVEASRALVDLALAAGAPDNVAVAVADVAR